MKLYGLLVAWTGTYGLTLEQNADDQTTTDGTTDTNGGEN